MALELGSYQLEIASDFGPRITSLRHGDGPEQLIRLGPETSLEHEGGRYEFRGGHRLWAAPEDARVTYAPDGHPCEVSYHDGVVAVVAPPDAAGLVKELAISADGQSLIIEHRMTQASGDPLRVAPWAITQLPMGGTAILPLEQDGVEPAPNRYLVLWPYTSIEDSRVTVSDEAVELRALDGPRFKLGVGPSPKRLGYFQDGWLFIKEIESAAGKSVPDFGAAGQVYLGQGFCELESVGGLTDLSDGAVAGLRERWTVSECADLDAAVQMTVGS